MELEEAVRFFESRGLEVGYLFPTEAELNNSSIRVHAQLRNYLKSVGLHDYDKQPKGQEAKLTVETFIFKEDHFIPAKSSLCRPDTVSGHLEIWISGLQRHAMAGSLVAILVHEGEIYVVNTSSPGILESANDPSSPLCHLLDLLSGGKNRPIDDRFCEWNLRLLRSFFSKASKGEEVFLRVDTDFLDQIGQDIGGDKGFVRAVQGGPSWSRPESSLVKRALDLVKRRHLRSASYKDPGDFDPTYRGLHAPVYLPYLAALVRNSSETIHGYYIRLIEDLLLPPDFNSNEMAALEEVWQDLQLWTNQCDGQFGFFHLRRLGGYDRIGVPGSQSIVKPHDLERIPHAFVQAQVSPGQDLPEEQLTRILNEARSSYSLFSASFKTALDDHEFDQPIRQIIRSAYIDWDGTLPDRSSNGGGSKGPSTKEVGSGEIGLCLAIESQYPLLLSPRWYLPALRDAGAFELSYEGLKWEGAFSGTEGASTKLNAGLTESLWKIAALGAAEQLYFDLQYGGIEDSEALITSLTLSPRPLWIMVPSFDSGQLTLKESNLPASGPAYLLSPPSNAARVTRYIEREQPECETILAQGLPKGWLLVCLRECSALTDEQRLLPDGQESAHPKPHPIRFTGGRSIRRGYSRMYLPYDLPTIELDAPEGVRIVSPEGVKLQEVVEYSRDTGVETSLLQPLKRFSVILTSTQSASYNLHAVTPDGSILGRTRLKIAGLGGEVVETGGPLSLDSLGKAMTSTEGLSGVLLNAPRWGANEQKLFNGFRLHPSELGSRVEFYVGQAGVHQMFLDRLAQSNNGSLEYGAARDLLIRLMQSKSVKSEPIFELLELQRRGHLELSKTQRGHTARVHAVKPTIYSLPLTSSDKQVWAVAGTLRLEHWELIANEEDAWLSYCENSGQKAFNSWRLIVADPELAKAACKRMGFELTEFPAEAIAHWAGSLRKFKDETLGNTMESIGDAQENAMCFNASKGLFSAPSSYNRWELWKAKDLDTRMDQLYVLAHSGKGEYAFVRDAGWGKWLAIDEFAIWVSTLPGMEDVCPLPINYDPTFGTVWIPARIGLPSILERALVLCGGTSPEVLSLERHDDQDGSCGRILLSRSAVLPPVLAVNRFYSEMADGRWLAYHYVPRHVAQLFADKLGAVLDII